MDGNTLMYTGMFLGAVLAIFICPCIFSIGLAKVGGYYKGITPIISAIPFVNIIYSEINYYGKAFLCTFSNIGIILFTAVRLVIAFTVPRTEANTTIHTITVILFILSWLFFVFATFKFVWDALSDSGKVPNVTHRFLMSLLFPIGEWWYSSKVTRVLVREMRENGDGSD